MTVDLRLPAARRTHLRVYIGDGTVREVQYDDEFTTVVATIPTRALEVFAAFLALPVSDPDTSSRAYLPS
jgi:hypothetical protein